MTGAKSTRKPINYGLIAIALTCFLIPLIGGQIYVPIATLDSGLAAVVSAASGGSEVPAWSHLIIAIPLFAVAFIALWKRRIVPLPRFPFQILFGAFFGLLILTSAQSVFPYSTLTALTAFLTCGLIFVGILVTAGRIKGPMAALSGLAVGSGVEAVMGIRSWEITRAIDPTWRIFGTWNNPNALAGILVIGCFASLAVFFTTERLGKLAGGLIFAVDLFALFLTQSRGGLLSLAVGLLVTLIVWAVKARKQLPFRQASLIFIPICLGAVLVFGAVHSTSAAKNQVGSRILANTAAGSQSKEFRVLLWKSAVQLIKDNPVGTGIGTFGYYSSKPGLVDQTGQTHNSLLQIAEEASPLASLALLALILLWLASCLKGKWQDSRRSVPLLFVIGAAAAIGTDGLFESDLYFFGTCAAVFALLAVGLLLAPDGCSPEISVRQMRRSGAVLLVIVSLLLAWTGAEQYCLARSRSAQSQNDPASMYSWAKSAQSLAPFNGETYYLEGLSGAAGTGADSFRQAADWQPETRILRAYANILGKKGDDTSAIITFKRALAIAPNDLRTLRDYFRFQKSSQDFAGAKETAKQMIAVETKKIFLVRGLSEIVPMETVEAREFLASEAGTPQEAASLLKGALPIQLQYAGLTVDTLLQFNKKYGAQSFAGESISEAKSHMESAVRDANRLQSICQSLHDSEGAAEAQRAAVSFEAALERLDGAVG